MRVPRIPVLLAAAGTAAAVRALRAFDANPDPADPSVLRADPPGETVWVDREDGTRIRAVVAGEGPTVVLAHGYGMTLREWNLVQPRLVDLGHRVICFDLRGHGESTIGNDGIEPEVIAGDYLAVLEHFDVTDAVLVGHSTGGYLAIATLLEHPAAATRLRGLVLFASLAGDAVKDAPQTRLQIPLIQSGVLQASLRFGPAGKAFAASIYGPNPSPTACQVFLDIFAATDHKALVPLMERLAHTSFYDRLHEIDLPTVVITGEEDQTTPRWHAEAMGDGIPGATNVWVPGAGHALNWSHPDVLVDEVTAMVATDAAT